MSEAGRTSDLRWSNEQEKHAKKEGVSQTTNYLDLDEADKVFYICASRGE